MNKRLNNVSVLRCLSAIMIVIYHILMILSPWKGAGIIPLYFGVQVFFFISGYLYEKIEIKNIKKFYLNRAIKIFIPVLFLCLIEFFLCTIFATNAINPLNWWSYISSELFALGHLWFIPNIFICYLILPLIKIAFDKSHKYNKLAIVFLNIFLILETIICLFTSMQLGIIIFVIGFALSRFQTLEKVYKQKNKSIFICILIFLITVLPFMYFIHCFPQNTFMLYHLSLFLQRICAVIFALTFSFIILIAFEFLNNKPTYKILINSDKYSFYIYLSHHIFAVGALSLLNITQNLAFNILLYLITIIILTAFLAFISIKTIKVIISKIKQ